MKKKQHIFQFVFIIAMSCAVAPLFTNHAGQFQLKNTGPGYLPDDISTDLVGDIHKDHLIDLIDTRLLWANSKDCHTSPKIL